MSDFWEEPAWTAAERRRRLEELVMANVGGDELAQGGTARCIRRPSGRGHQAKRQRTFAAAPLANTSTWPSPPVENSPKPAVRVKTEEEIQAFADLQLKNPQEQVKIYVGPKNKVFTVGIVDIEKSPVLRSLISNVSAEGPFIMHPELAKIGAGHFTSVWQFLLMDEYVPAITENPHSADTLPKQLDRLTSAEDYRREVLRAGHLYVIAKKLGMATLEDLIFREITQAQYQQYGVKCELDLAMIVFSRPEESELATKWKFRPLGDTNHGDGKEGEDALENWLIDSLVNKFQPMFIQHAQLFFQVANHGACARRRFERRVLSRKVELWDEIGKEVIAIPDDD